MLRYFSPEKRRRFAPAILVVGLALVGKVAYEEMPREEPMRFALPGPNVAALRVIYSSGDELYGGFEQHFPNGAPALVEHAPKLSPGHYELAIELTSATGKITRLTRSVELPSPGPLKIPLTEEH